MGVAALVAALKACDTVVDLELPSGRRADGDTTDAHNPGDPTSRHQHTLPGPAGRHRVVPLKTGELATVATTLCLDHTTFVLILYFSSYFVRLSLFHSALFCTKYIPTILVDPTSVHIGWGAGIKPYTHSYVCGMPRKFVSETAESRYITDIVNCKA